MKKILKMDPVFYKLMERRIQENHPRFKSKIHKMKKRLLAENIKLGSQEEFISHELKQELEVLILNNKIQTEDYDILQAILYERELKGDKISIKNLLNSQSRAIEDQINTLLEDEKDNQDDNLIQNFSTANQNLKKINKMDEFEFNRYHSQVNGENTQQQTRLDRLITKQLQEINHQFERQVSEKEIKKRLTKQMFDQYKFTPIQEEQTDFKKTSEPIYVDETIDMNEDNSKSINKRVDTKETSPPIEEPE